MLALRSRSMAVMCILPYDDNDEKFIFPFCASIDRSLYSTLSELVVRMLSALSLPYWLNDTKLKNFKILNFPSKLWIIEDPFANIFFVSDSYNIPSRKNRLKYSQTHV